MSFPLAGHADPECWDRFEYRMPSGDFAASSTVRPYAGGPGVMVGVRTVAGKPWGKVECNPARLYDPDGCALLPLQLFGAAAATMLAAAQELVEYRGSGEDLRVKRVDVARDFRMVTNTSLYVRGLEPVKRPYAKRVFRYSNPSLGNAETLFAGSGAGGVRLYDQQQAYGEKVLHTYGEDEVGGRLRFEVEARGDWLEKVGIKRVSDVDTVALKALADQRWEWSGMGTSVTGPVNMVEVVGARIDAGEISRTVGERLIGRLVMDSLGQARRSSKGSAARYTALQRQLSIMPSEDLWQSSLERQAVGRLDYDQGLEELSLSA